MKTVRFVFQWCLFCFLGLAVSSHVAGGTLDSGPARLGINLSGLNDLNTEYPLVDVFKLARPWISQKKDAKWGSGPALDLVTNGWIRQLDPDCWAETLMMTFGHAPSGDYVCRFIGDGDIEFSGAQAQVVSRAPGRIVVNLHPEKEGVFLRLKRTNPANPVREIHFVMPGHEDSFARRPFNPAFLRRWRGCSTLRFMDWMQTNGSEQRAWSDRPTPGTYTYALKGAPMELIVELCNELDANPWICLPHGATDDYVRECAALMKSQLNRRRAVYVEYSNEVWNGIFAQHKYAEEEGKRLALGPTERPWEGAAHFHALRSTQIFKIWEDMFGGHDRLVRVVAWQAAGGEYWSDQMVLGFQDTGRKCDALAIAPYITFLPSPKGDRPHADEVAAWSLDQVFAYLETNALPQSVGWMRTQKKVAEKYGVKLICYESGQHLVGVGGGENNDQLTSLFLQANHDARMGKLYTTYLNTWRETGGGLMCLFSSVGKYSKWGSWGLLEYGDEDASPKLDAVLRWNEAALKN